MDSTGIPLMPSVARRIIEELFKQQPQWKRDALITEVKRIHAERGGVPGSQEPASVVAKALGYLHEDGKVIKQDYGYWKSMSSDSATATPATAALPVSNIAAEEADDTPVAEKEIGDGDESVYVYFNPNDRKLASHEGRTVWECKVGRTSASDVFPRIQGQGTGTALSHTPVIGLVIRTHDSVALERALHSSLRLIDARVPDSGGVEWFMTSPEHVKKWFVAFQGILAALSPDAQTA